MSTRAIAPIVGVTRQRVSQIRNEVASDLPPAPAPRPTESELMTGTEWTPEPAYVEGTRVSDWGISPVEACPRARREGELQLVVTRKAPQSEINIASGC